MLNNRATWIYGIKAAGLRLATRSPRILATLRLNERIKSANKKQGYSPANLGFMLFCWLFLLCQSNLGHASWNASVDTIPGYSDSPQRACEYALILHGLTGRPYRLAWITQQGDSGGFYASGFDVPGPLLPNPENNYAPYTPGSMPVCIYNEHSVNPYVNLLQYRPDRPAQTLELIGPAEVRPSNTGGTSEITLAAKVTDGANPKPGVAVTLSVDVVANSGGHEHHSGSRPKGILSAAQGTTDANGQVVFTFSAPQVSGIHTIKSRCSSCSNSSVSKEIQVKVPGLVPISPNPPQNADGTYVYALTSVDALHAGSGRYHRGQYWLTEIARLNLRALTESFSAEGWGTVGLNDASMLWGGVYDINGNWGPSHQGHREGNEIDISFTRANNPVSASKQKDFYDKFCKNKAVEASFSLLHHFVLLPHFHVYLEKQKACGRTET